MTAYKVYFFYDPEYQGYVADALDLPGCVSQGKTPEEAKLNIKEAIEAWLEVEKEKYSENRLYRFPVRSFVEEIEVIG